MWWRRESPAIECAKGWHCVQQLQWTRSSVYTIFSLGIQEKMSDRKDVGLDGRRKYGIRIDWWIISLEVSVESKQADANPKRRKGQRYSPVELSFMEGEGPDKFNTERRPERRKKNQDSMISQKVGRTKWWERWSEVVSLKGISSVKSSIEVEVMIHSQKQASQIFSETVSTKLKPKIKSERV